MNKYTVIFLVLLFSASCMSREDGYDPKDPISKKAKELCSEERIALSAACAKKHGPITIVDEQENSEKFKKYMRCNRQLGGIYKKCFRETTAAFKSGKPAPVEDRIKKYATPW